MLGAIGRNLLLERGSGARHTGAGATMMLTFKTLSRILSSATTFP
jgi:hypothetical protein